MSNYIIEIIPPDVYYLDVSTSFEDILNDGTNTLQIIRSENIYNIEVLNANDPILINDLPDNIPISKIAGNLPVSRIDGLDEYLNQYEFDCGIPR